MELDIAFIRKMLTIIVVVLVIYLLQVLSVIFIPLAFGLLGALFFSPLLRGMTNRKVPGFVGIIVILCIVSITIFGAYKIVELTSMELANVEDGFVEKLNQGLDNLAQPIVEIMNIEPKEGKGHFMTLMNNEKVISNLFKNVEVSLNIAKNVLTTLFLSLFFMILFLAGSMNVQRVLELLVFKKKNVALKMYHQIEKDIFKFIAIKTTMSLLTGIGIAVTCYLFDVSFPIFWGVLGFLLNFIQLIGSIVVVLVLMLFALIELDLTGALLLFSLIILGIQLLIGSVVEPILLGKSFSINTITILVMLSIWGLVWGIPGLVLSVPITALIKKVMEKSKRGVTFAEIIS